MPDLSPRDRAEARLPRPRAVFIAESPHVSEVTPEKLAERRPLCGKAGLAWWGALTAQLDGAASTDVSLPALLDFCRRHRLAVLNAVQYPLDPKVAESFAGADPAETIGFSKAPGPLHYKKAKDGPVLERALAALRDRLDEAHLRDVPIYCLGNDSEWLVRQALGKEEFARRVRGRIPHPSAWWRRGGEFGRIARAKLREIL